MKLTLPLPPNTPNQRKHWRVRINQKKAYWRRLNVVRGERGFPKPTEAPERARIRVTLYVWNILDPDNAMARLKWLLDWLVAWDYLPDDNPKVLEWAGMPEQEIDRKNQRVEVEITDVGTMREAV